MITFHFKYLVVRLTQHFCHQKTSSSSLNVAAPLPATLSEREKHQRIQAFIDSLSSPRPSSKMKMQSRSTTEKDSNQKLSVLLEKFKEPDGASCERGEGREEKESEEIVSGLRG